MNQLANETEGLPLRAVVVGAGPAGCVTAFFLAKRGFQVDLFEKRPSIPRPQEHGGSTEDQEKATVFDRSETRSYSMMLTRRAFVALEAAGIELPDWIGQRIRGSIRNMSSGKKMKFYHGKDTDNRTVARQTLTAWLLYHLQDSFPESARIHMGYGFAGFKDSQRIAFFERSKGDADASQELLEVPFDLLVGADGVSSSVRTHLLKSEEAEGGPSGESPLTCSQTTSLVQYKTLVVPGPIASKHGYQGETRQFLNTWQCGIMMVPMSDGSLWGGSMQQKLVDAKDAETVTSVLSTEAPALLPMLQEANPGFAQQFVEQPAIPQGTTTVLSRFHSGSVVLIGDAAHSMVPTLGQGCNTAIEDCLVLDQALEAHGVTGHASPGEIPRACAEFTERRLPDARAIQALNAKQFFPRTSVDRIKLLSIMLGSKVLPFLVGTPSFLLLFSAVPFRRMLAQKEWEDRAWRGLQISTAVLGASVATLALRQFL